MKYISIKINKYTFFSIWQFTKQISENTLALTPENQSLSHIILSEFYEELDLKINQWKKKSNKLLYKLSIRYSVARCLALEINQVCNELHYYNQFTLSEVIKLLDMALLNDYDLQLKKLL